MGGRQALGEVWSADASASLQSILDSTDTPALLRRTLAGALSWQVRNVISVERALAAPRIAPQWVAAVLALGAVATVEGTAGTSVVELAVPLRRGVDRRVTALHVPDGACWGEASVARTPADEPIVAAFAAVDWDGEVVCRARVALTGVWPEPARLAKAPLKLVGGPLDDAWIRRVAATVEAEVEPRGDYRGSQEYRRAMAGVLTRRALERCRR